MRQWLVGNKLVLSNRRRRYMRRRNIGCETDCSVRQLTNCRCIKCSDIGGKTPFSLLHIWHLPYSPFLYLVPRTCMYTFITKYRQIQLYPLRLMFTQLTFSEISNITTSPFTWESFITSTFLTLHINYVNENPSLFMITIFYYRIPLWTFNFP